MLLVACSPKTENSSLPRLGPFTVIESAEGASDTVFRSTRDFEFVNQDNEIVTKATIDGKIHVVDFFFTSCPTICPKMKQQMLRIYKEFEGQSQLVLLSHTIDPERDSTARLAAFAHKLGVGTPLWHFLTGPTDSIYSMAGHYMLSAMVDPDAPGGFAHSGAFLLIDADGQIRGIYDGTLVTEVDSLITDIEWLLARGGR